MKLSWLLLDRSHIFRSLPVVLHSCTTSRPMVKGSPTCVYRPRPQRRSSQVKSLCGTIHLSLPTIRNESCRPRALSQLSALTVRVQQHKSLRSWLRKLPTTGISCARRPTWVRRAQLRLSTQIFRTRALLRNSSLMESPTLLLLNTTMAQSLMLNTDTPKNVAFLLRQSRMHLVTTHNRQQ